MINAKPLAMALVGVMLMACAPEKQDDGAVKPVALLVDSAQSGGSKIVQGVVYADLNENGRLDLFEPYAMTGAGGQTRADSSCFAEDVPGDCLMLSDPDGPVLVRLIGGFLSAEGVPFVGQYSARVGSTAMHAPTGATGSSTKQLSAQAINALTTLKTALSDAQAAELETRLVAGDGMRLDAIFSAWVRQVIDAFDAASSDEQRRLGLLIDAFVVRIAEYLLSDGASLTTLIDDPGPLRTIVSAAYAEIFPSKQLSPSDQQKVADLIHLVLEAVDHFAVENASLGARRALQVLLVKLGATLVESDAEYFNTPDGDAFIAALNEGEFDLEGLAETPLSGTGANLAESARIDEGAPRFDSIGGQYLEFAGDNGDDPYVKAQLYFAEGSARGDVRLCVRYQSSDATDPMNTQGSLIRGQWAAVDSHTLVLELRLLGGRYSATVRGVDVDTYRFDFDGEFSEYTGPAPFAQAGSVPDTSFDCVARL